MSIPAFLLAQYFRSFLKSAGAVGRIKWHSVKRKTNPRSKGTAAIGFALYTRMSEEEEIYHHWSARLSEG